MSDADGNAERAALEKRLENIEYRADVLEALVMEVVADCREGARGYEIEERIGKVMRKLDGEDQ
jgi:hypothetical protein